MRRWLQCVAVAGVAFTLAILGANYDTPLPPTDDSVTMTPTPESTITATAEDDPGFDCRRQGNHICGPASGHPAGCYSGGRLVIPWTNYNDPHADPLWAQRKSPC